MDYPSGENGPISSCMLYLFEWMKTGFQTDFVTVLDTSKRARTIKHSTVFFFCVNEQNGFKNSTCKRLFLETEKRI